MTRVIRGSDLAKLALDRRLRHVPAEIGKEVASGNEAKKLVAIHDNRDASPIEYAQQIIDFHIRLQCFQLISHRLAHWIIKMRGVAMHFYQDVRFIDDTDNAATLAHHRKL